MVVAILMNKSNLKTDLNFIIIYTLLLYNGEWMKENDKCSLLWSSLIKKEQKIKYG